MIATFLIGPSTVEGCCDWFVRSLITSGYATNGMIHSDYQGQDERQNGMLELMVIDTSSRNCYESSRFIGQLDDPETAILVITLRTE